MNEVVIQTLFTVLGIQYSVLLSSVTSFSIDNVLNTQYRKVFKKRINLVTKKSSVFFVISVLLFVLSQTNILEYSIFSYITLFFMCFSGVYFVLAFVNLQQLRLDVSDRIIDESKEFRQ